MSAENQPNNEPTATEQMSVEKTANALADAVADVLGVGIGAKLYLGCAILILFLTVIGTPVTWMIQRDPKAGVSVYISLWRETKSYQAGTTVFTSVSDITCDDVKNRFKAAEAFAIISIGFALVAVLVAFVNVKLFNQFKVPVVVVNVLLLASTLITWGIGVSLYTQSFCNFPSRYAQEYYLSAGAGLFIAAFVLTVVGPILLFADPAPLEGDRLVRFSTILFTLLMQAGFALSLGGIAYTTWFRRIYGVKTDATYLKSEFTLWDIASTSKYAATERLMYKDLVACDDFVQMWYCAEAFAVLSVIFTGLASIVGFINTAFSGKPYARLALFFGVLASSFCLVTWALGAKIFYGRWCNNLYYMQGNMYTMRPGFAVFVVAWVLTAIAALVSAGVYIAGKDSPFAASSRAGILFTVGAFMSFILCVVGAPTNWFLFDNNALDLKIEITPWQITTTNGVATTDILTRDNACDEQRKRYLAIEAFVVLSCFFVFVSFALGAARITYASLRTPTSVFAILASLAQLIAWGIGGSLYHQSFCTQASLFKQGYNISAGFGLYVSAWCLTLVIAIIHILMD